MVNIDTANIDQRISTVTIKGKPLTSEQIPKLDQWFRTLLWCSKVPGSDPNGDEDVPDDDPKFEIYRAKARLPLTDGTVKVLQGVRDVFEIKDSEELAEEGKEIEQHTKVVIIGRDLGSLELEASYRSKVEA